MVLQKDKEEKAQQFIDNELHDMFQNTSLPRHATHNIPHRPGSRHTHSQAFNSHAATLTEDTADDKTFLRPPPRQKMTRIEVSYAAVAAKAKSASPPKTISKSPRKQNPETEIKKFQQSVRQQIKNTNVELHADLEAQVCALQAQIQSLQAILQSLQAQVQNITTTYRSIPTTTPPITTKVNAKKSEPEATSPREPAPKRQCPNQLNPTASSFEPEIQEMDEDTTSKNSYSQPNPPTNPNLGMDPGEADSTLL